MKYFPQFILKNFNSVGKFKEYYSVLQLDSSAELIILALYKYICFFSPESFESELYTVWYFESEVTQSCPTLCDPWTVVGQAPPSMGFSRREYWTGLPFPSPGDLPDSGIKPRSPALQADSLPSEPPGNPVWYFTRKQFRLYFQKVTKVPRITNYD